MARIYSVDTDASFVYNENGLRVQKTVNGVVTKYILNGKHIAHMTRGNDELHFFYDASGKPVVVVYNGTPYSYVKNVQGDIVAILNSAGTVVVSYVYDAWGRSIATTGSMADTLGVLNPFRYRGYVFDEETEMYYLRSRYYSNCRFLNSDSLSEICKTFAHNIFTYCDNNPVPNADPNGTETWTTGSTISGAIGVGVSFSTGYCWDDEGNIAAYFTVVGSEQQIEDAQADISFGVGQLGVSAAICNQYYPNKSVKELAGRGGYVGFGIDWFVSLGLDAIATFQSIDDNFSNSDFDDGVQFSFGGGIGIDLVHYGTSYTYIFPIFDEGEYICPWNRKFYDSFDD